MLSREPKNAELHEATPGDNNVPDSGLVVLSEWTVEKLGLTK